MKAVPISPPNRRTVWNSVPIVKTSAGFIDFTASTTTAVSAKDWPSACRICEGRKSSVAQSWVRRVREEAGDANENRAGAEDPARVHAGQKPAEREDDQKLRQGDPEQNRADLQLAVVLDDLEIGGNDIGGREDDEAEAGEDQKDRHDPLLRQEPEVEERLFDDELPRDKGERQQSSREQEPVDEAVVDPVEAVALVEAGVKQGETEPGISESGPVEVAQQAEVDLLARRSVPDAREHDGHREAKLPLDPAPGEIVRIPALERG